MNSDHLPPSDRPAARLLELEIKNKRLARLGLEQAFNDCMEALQRFDPSKTVSLNDQLISAGLPPLRTYLRNFSKKYKAIVKRGRIRTETEFYMLRNIVEDPNLPEEEKQSIMNLLDQFEYQA